MKKVDEIRKQVQDRVDQEAAQFSPPAAPPQGKDPGEVVKQGVDLEQWIKTGLPPALTLSEKIAPDFKTEKSKGNATICDVEKNSPHNPVSENLPQITSEMISECLFALVDDLWQRPRSGKSLQQSKIVQYYLSISRISSFLREDLAFFPMYFLPFNLSYFLPNFLYTILPYPPFSYLVKYSLIKINIYKEEIKGGFFFNYP